MAVVSHRNDTAIDRCDPVCLQICHDDRACSSAEMKSGPVMSVSRDSDFLQTVYVLSGQYHRMLEIKANAKIGTDWMKFMMA